MTATADDQHEGRVAMITSIAIEAKAESSAVENAMDDLKYEKLVYARAFEAWANSLIAGTAEDIFETVEEVLDTLVDEELES
jgi:hypothetical protein